MTSVEYLEERLDRLTEELGKLRRALEAKKEGVPFTEEFDEELFLERDEYKSARSEIVVMMHHLLKFRFSTVDRALHSWFTRSIALPRQKIIRDTCWKIGTKNESYDKSIVNKLLEEYEEMYKESIKAYEDDADNYSDLKPGLKYIPVECPWTLRDLVRTPYPKLLEMIPAVDEEDEEHLKTNGTYY